MQRFEHVLVICPEFGVMPDGSYKASGLAQFARCVFRTLASSNNVGNLTGWGLLDSEDAAQWFRTRYLANVVRARDVELRGFAGNRLRMGLSFLTTHQRYDMVMFLHTGVARLSFLRPRGRSSVWLVGVDVRRPLGWRERFAIKKADPLLSISTFSSEEMRRYNPALPSAKTVHLCAEPDDPWLEGDRSGRSPPPYSAAERVRAVLIVARQARSHRYKGHEQLIGGWSEVLAKVPDAELWIAGSGNDHVRLCALATAAGHTESKVRFFGNVSHERLLELYSTARVFAMPSTGEGFGLVFVEAMRFGLPCICSRDAAAEIVVHEKTGLVVDQNASAIAAACVRLLSDCDAADRMATCGRLRYEREFTFDAMRARLFRALDLNVGAVDATRKYSYDVNQP